MDTIQTCIICRDKRRGMIRCYACDDGPMCQSCMGNDIEHGVEDTPICQKCVEITHWCNDCHMFIALPSDAPLMEGYLCEGHHDIKCGVLLCEYCSYGDYYFSASEDEEPPQHRQCEKCRHKLQ